MMFRHIPCGKIFCYIHKSKHESNFPKSWEQLDSLLDKCFVCEEILQCKS